MRRSIVDDSVRSRKILGALRELYALLEGTGVKWTLVGSASLALRGLDVEPGDIDIMTSEKDAYRINDLLKEYEVKPAKFGSSDLFKSHLCELKVRGVKVEVMGGLYQKLHGCWSSVSRRQGKTILLEADGMRIRIFRLKDILRAMEGLGREKDKSRILKTREAIANGKE